MFFEEDSDLEEDFKTCNDYAKKYNNRRQQIECNKINCFVMTFRFVNNIKN